MRERYGERKKLSQARNSLGFDIKKSGFQFHLYDVTSCVISDTLSSKLLLLCVDRRKKSTSDEVHIG